MRILRLATALAIVALLALGCGRAARAVEWQVRSGADLLSVTVVDHLRLVRSVDGVLVPTRLPDGRQIAVANAGLSLEAIRLSWSSGSCQTRPTITLAASGIGTIVVLDPGPFRCGPGIAEPRSIELTLARPVAAAFVQVERQAVAGDS